MVEKRLFIKSDIQLLFWIRSSCTMEGHGVHILLRQVHLRCQFDRKFYTSFFLPFLQTPSVESDSNFISSDQMSIVKKEFGEHTYTVFYVYIYIYMFERRDFSCLSRFVNFHDNVWARSVAWETQEEWVFCNNLITFYGARTGVSPDCIPSIRDRRSSLPLPFKNSDDMKVFDPSCAKYIRVLLFLEMNANFLKFMK